MRAFMTTLFITLGINTPLVFGSDMPESPADASYQSTRLQEIQKLVDIGSRLNPEQSRTLANKISRIYLTLLSENAGSDLIEFARNSARGLWLKDYQNESAIKIESIADSLVTLNCVDDAKSLYMIAATKSLTSYYIERLADNLKRLGFVTEAISALNDYLAKNPKLDLAKKSGITKKLNELSAL